MRTFVVLLILASGCATLKNGEYEKIAISSEPPGSTARIECRDGWHSEGITPVALPLFRQADPCVLWVTADGYEAFEFPLARISINVDTWLDRAADRMHPDNWLPPEGFDVLVDVIGMLVTFGASSVSDMVDDHTGATYRHDPNRVSVRLKPVS